MNTRSTLVLDFFTRHFRSTIFCLACIAVALTSANAIEPPPSSPAPPKENGVGQFLNDLLPMAWQKRPKVRFHVYTEMTSEGRKWRVPTPDKPLRYFSPPGTFAQMGWSVSAGEKPPPWAELQAAMQKALAENGYVPVADEHQHPDVLIVFSYGSHGTELLNNEGETLVPQLTTAEGVPDLPPSRTTAEELLPLLLASPPNFFDPKAVKDVIDRAGFIGGERVARELQAALKSEIVNSIIGGPTNPAPDSPFQLLLHGASLYGADSEVIKDVIELAFHTCYFVTATAYDFSGVEKKQKISLWQTRMTIEAQGVALDEVLKPLIVNTGSFLGRETPEAVVVTKRINREGRVDVGTPTVVKEGKPEPAKTESATAPDKSGQR